MRTISRRTILKGLGTALALPCLEAMLPSAAAAAPAAAPKRMLFLYVPNGVHVQDWTPTTTGRDWELPYLFEPLKEFRQDFSILTGLTCDKARPNGDGPGDHARAMSSFLTGRQARKTHGADIKVGISVDQLAAQKFGTLTRFPSLEIGCEGPPARGQLRFRLQLRVLVQPVLARRLDAAAEGSQSEAGFDRLFSSENIKEAAEARARRERYHKSILDLVAEDAGSLRKDLGSADQRKLDEYLSGVREVELRLAKATQDGTKEVKLPKDAVRPSGIPKSYEEHLRLMTDVLVLALQGDVTRISTFVYANEGSNRSYASIGVPEGHHDLSHHESKAEKLNKIKKINRFHLTQLGYLLGKLKGIKEGEATLLDSCMILYGSGNSDGNRHNHDDLPILLAGKAGGAFHPGQHIRFRRETPLTNLYLTMLDTVGVKISSFGDSTGRLSGL